MPRRKRTIDDGFSDSDEESEGGDFRMNEDMDAQEERALFEDPYQRKRRRKDTKKDALYGVFASDSESDTAKPRTTSKRDWAKAPAFVSGGNQRQQDMSGKGEDGDTEELVSDSSEQSRHMSPDPAVIQEDGGDEDQDMEEPESHRGGLGSHNKTPSFDTKDNPSQNAFTSAPSTPSAFASSSNPFIRQSAAIPKPVKISASERAHFNNISGSFGARMLAKMGWQAGSGLGTTGEGIVTPVESKLRPERAGIAYKGFEEKTQQSKMEAKRRGEVVSDEERDPVIKQRKKAVQARAEVWKKPRKSKRKTEHLTYEEILAEADASTSMSSGIGQIIDATGAVHKEVSSLSELSFNTWIPSHEPTRIPEVRHNIVLIFDACKNNLDELAREGKSLEAQKTTLAAQDLKVQQEVQHTTDLISRLQRIQVIANDIKSKSQEISSHDEQSLDPLSPYVFVLSTQFPAEVETYGLDSILVGAIAPIFRRLVAQWNPIQHPTAFISVFRNWAQVLRINKNAHPVTSANAHHEPSMMTPFESLLWNVWLPRVRTSINNDWLPHTADPAVKLYDSWANFLPDFIRDNIMDQLILPKVQKAITDWSPKDGTALQSILFPWLPHAGLRLDDLLGDARRKVKALLKNSTIEEALSLDLNSWKDAFDTIDWDNLILKSIVPKLGRLLREEFQVNPRKQSMEPFKQVLQWSDLIRPGVISQLFETEFFPKWLQALYIWLTQPNANLEEVAQWYAFWKGSFPPQLQGVAGISQGFTRGLQLMNKAVELGPLAATQLPHPNSMPSPATGESIKKAKIKAPSRINEVTFRSIVEEFVARHNLLFMPSGRAHEKSRMPLFRITPRTDGKGGLLVYILDDAVWAAAEGAGGPSEPYRAVALEEVVQRANNTN